MVKLFLALIDNEFSQYLSRLQVQYASIDLLVLLLAPSFVLLKVRDSYENVDRTFEKILKEGAGMCRK